MCRSHTSTSIGSPSCPMRSGETSSRTSTTPSPSSSGRKRARECCRRRACGWSCVTRAQIGARSGSTVLILAFDTATSVATSALVRGGDILGERATTPIRVLEDVDALLREAGVEPRELDALAVGIGPGSFTGVRMGLAAARALALSLDVPAAGVSTLLALAAGAPPDAVPLIDAKRRELFLEQDAEIIALPAAAFEAPEIGRASCREKRRAPRD